MAIWGILVIQTIVVLWIVEPYPAFAFPGFGFKQEILKDGVPVVERARILAVNSQDTLDLTDQSFIGQMSKPQFSAFYHRLIQRSQRRLKRADKPLKTRIVYRKYLEPTTEDIVNLKQWLIEDFNFVPSAFVVVLEKAPVTSDHTTGALFTSKEYIDIEVFE